MGMELPAELRNLFSVLTGSEWPTADEDRLWELAQVYGSTADRLEVDLPQMVIRIKNKVRENFDATAADFFDESVDQFTGGERNYLGEGTAVARELQDYVHNAGTQVQYAKWMIIGQLVQLAAEIAWAVAMAPFTFGASLAKIPIFQAIARTVIGRVMYRLLSTLLQQMMISQFFALTMDALIQRIQIDNGVRDGWDRGLTEDAAKGAMLDGLFGTAAVFGGNALSTQFNKLLGNSSGAAIAHRLDENLPTGQGSGAGLPDGIGSVMGRNNGELLRPFGMDDRPGWSRPVDGERFRGDMGTTFADSLGPAMGPDRARAFGEQYADAFARNWGRNGLDGALERVVSVHGRDLDPRMRDFLTNGVPASVRGGLSDVGTHWKSFLAQLGGQGIANAGQGMLSEGFYNLLFSDQQSFSITWLSGVSGFVSGALQQSLTTGGLLLIDHLKQAGLPDGVRGLADPPMGPDSSGGGAGAADDGAGTGPAPDAGRPGTGNGDAGDRQQDRGDSGAAVPPPPELVTTDSTGGTGGTEATTASSFGEGRGNGGSDQSPTAPQEDGTFRPAAPPVGQDTAPWADDADPGNRPQDTQESAGGADDRPLTRPEQGEQEDPGAAPEGPGDRAQHAREHTSVPDGDGFPRGSTREAGDEAPVDGGRTAEDGAGAVGGESFDHGGDNGSAGNGPDLGAFRPVEEPGIQGGDGTSPPIGSDRGGDAHTPDGPGVSGGTVPAGRPDPAYGPSPQADGAAAVGPGEGRSNASSVQGDGAPGDGSSGSRADSEAGGTGDVRANHGASGSGEEGREASGASSTHAPQEGAPNDGTSGQQSPAAAVAPVAGGPAQTPPAQGQGPVGDGRRQPESGVTRPDPDAPAPISRGLKTPENWQDARAGAEVARVGTPGDRSGVGTDGVEVLDGYTGQNLSTSVSERAFDVRRIPLHEPAAGGPDHVTELTVRIRFHEGEGVGPDEAGSARRTFLHQLNEVLNEKYTLPGGDQLHIRVEPVGSDGRPHTDVTWVRDNPDLPGRSDTANWRLDDGPDVWLHETLHRIGLNDEYRDPSSPDGDGRPPAVLRRSRNSSAVHDAGGYMDSPHGRGGEPPRVLNHYLEQIEAQVYGASRFDAPARLADLPGTVHRELAAGLDPEGTRPPQETIALFGAAYDLDVRGRDGRHVRADLPTRLRDQFDRTVQDWRHDGRLNRALETADRAGMGGPLSRLPAPAEPVTTQGDGTHRAAAPLSRLFGAKDGSGREGGRSSESHRMSDRPRHGGRGHRTDPGEGPSRRSRTEGGSGRDRTGRDHDESGLSGRDGTGGHTADGRSGRRGDGGGPGGLGRSGPAPVEETSGEQSRTGGDRTDESGPPAPPAATTRDRLRPQRVPEGHDVGDRVRALLSELTRPGFLTESTGYTGARANPDADVSALRRRVLDHLAREGVEPADNDFASAFNGLTDGTAGARHTVEIPVRARTEGERGRDGRRASPARGRLRLDFEQVWRNSTEGGSNTRPLLAVESRALSGGTGRQNSRKEIKVLAPFTGIGEVLSHVSLISGRAKANFAHHQRGTEFQTESQFQNKHKVDVVGDDPARFTGHYRVHGRLEMDPPPSGSRRSREGGSSGRNSGQDGPGRRRGRSRDGHDGDPVRSEFSDAVTDVYRVVLPGHLRAAEDTEGPRPPDAFGTDRGGAPARSPRFSGVLGVLSGDLPPRFPVDMQTLQERLVRMDRGEVLRVRYEDDDGNPQHAEISGGPVSYTRIGPEMKDTSFSDRDKTAVKASSNAARTDKQEFRVAAGTMIGSEPAMVVRAGPELGGGARAVQKSTRTIEHGSERVRSIAAQGDSGFYRVERTYRVNTTEPQGTGRERRGDEGAPRDGGSGRRRGGPAGDDRVRPPRVVAGTFALRTLDQVLASEAEQFTGREEAAGTGARPSAPSASGTGQDRVRHLGGAVPVQAEWSDGDLWNADGRSPLTAVADRVHRAVFDAHPELVTDPDRPGDGKRGFGGQVRHGPDLRVSNTVALYEQIERMVHEADTLLDGTDIVLRTGGMGNALTPPPGRRRALVGALPFGASVRDDDRDGAAFYTVRVQGELEGARFAGSRPGGSLNSGLNAWTSQGSGRQNTLSGGTEGAFGLQLRFGETEGALPAGMFEFGTSATFDRDKATPGSNNRKSGVQAGSSAKGTLDAWSYGLRVRATLGTNEAVDVTPDGGPRLRVEGPRTVPVPGELAPHERGRADEVRDSARQAREALDRAGEEVESARNELDRRQRLADRLPDLTAERDRVAARESVLRQRARDDLRAAEDAERTRDRARDVARETLADAVEERLGAARSVQEAAEGLLRDLRHRTDRASEPSGPGARDGAGTPPARPELADLDADRLDRNSTQEDAAAAWDRAQRNWEAVEAYERDLEVDLRQGADDGSGAVGAPDPHERRSEEAVDLRARADESAEDAKEAEQQARDDEAERIRLTEEASRARRTASDSTVAAREATMLAGRAQTAVDGAEAASAGLDDSRGRVRAALSEEERVYRAAATAEGLARDHRFAEARDARLSADPPPREPARNRTPAVGALVPLDTLPHAPEHTDARRLFDALMDSVRHASGFISSTRSGEAVAGHWRVVSSAKSLAAHSADVHGGGIPLQGQFEDGKVHRSNISLNLRADRLAMYVSGALHDGGLDFIHRTESDRIAGVSRSTVFGTSAGVKGEAAPNPSDSRHNRLRASAGVVPIGIKRTAADGDSLTYSEEDQLAFPGSTVAVTTVDRFDVETMIRSRWNFLVSVPHDSGGRSTTQVYTSTDGPDGPAHGSSADRGSDGEVRGPDNGDAGDDGGNSRDGEDARDGRPITTDARYRVLDLAQSGSLPGTQGLDTALSNARSAPEGTALISGRGGFGYALDGPGTGRAVQGIAESVSERSGGFVLTEQSKRDIQVALSVTNTRGTNLRLQEGGLVLPVNVQESRMGGQRPSVGGWLRVELVRDGAPAFGPVESGFSSARTDTESIEDNHSSGKERKHGLTSGIDGGVNPVRSTGTDADGNNEFPRDRFWSSPATTGQSWEAATTRTHLTSDTDLTNETRTVTAPGINTSSATTVRYTLALDHHRGTVVSGVVEAGNRTEVFQAGSFRAQPPPSGVQDLQTPTDPADGGRAQQSLSRDPDAYARDWRSREHRGVLPRAMVEGVGHGPIAHAALVAQARALGWSPGDGDRSASAAIDHLSKKGPGARAHVLGSAADGQVLRERFAAAVEGGRGAPLVGPNVQGPFAVPGLETNLFLRPDPSRAHIIGAGELERENDTQQLHRDEVSNSDGGGAGVTTGVDVSGMKGVPDDGSGFKSDSALIGGGPTTAGASSTSGGGDRQAALTMRTDNGGVPEKGRGYLVRVPVHALLVARDTGEQGSARAEETESTVDLWLDRGQVEALQARVGDDTFGRWDAVAERQKEAAETEKKLGSALDRQLGLTEEGNRASLRDAADLLAFDRDPRIWSDTTSTAVDQLRTYFGSSAQDRGWGRPSEQSDAERRAAHTALDRLRRGVHEPGGLTGRTLEALGELMERRDALHTALAEHRRALDNLFGALGAADGSGARTAVNPREAPPARPGEPGPSRPRDDELTAFFDRELNPPSTRNP